jgi:hypothetical protein
MSRGSFQWAGLSSAPDLRCTRDDNKVNILLKVMYNDGEIDFPLPPVSV